jgi:predicted RNA polymerase sigma factor
MVFVCCHPLNPQEAQVALALKTLCGFMSKTPTAREIPPVQRDALGKKKCNE